MTCSHTASLLDTLDAATDRRASPPELAPGCYSADPVLVHPGLDVGQRAGDGAVVGTPEP